MWKFKTSKYKNAHPKVSKKEEWITNLAAANFLPSCGNHIQASAAYISYNTDVGGGGRGCLGLLPLSAQGRQVTNGVTLIHAHSEHVTDFGFNPFDDFHLATCSQDGSLKTWELPEDLEGVEHLTEPVSSIQVGEHKVECLRWHPSAANILAVAAGPTAKIFDVNNSVKVYDHADHEDTTQALDWHGNGTLLVTGNKDLHLRIFDPRASSLVQSTKGHEGLREMRVLWLGDSDYILSTGCDAMRNREVIIRDVRNFGEKLCTQQLDTSTGTLIPFYDPERSMIFLCGKGDTTLQYFEFSSATSTLTFNSADHVHQMKGAALAPKRAVDVMSAEVHHMLLLIKNAIVPLPICVPRKSYTDFHSELFPDIPSDYPAMTAEEWQSGENKLVTKVSQDPKTTPELLRRKGAEPRWSGTVGGENAEGAESKVNVDIKPAVPSYKPSPPPAAPAAPVTPSSSPVNDDEEAITLDADIESPPQVAAPPPSPPSPPGASAVSPPAPSVTSPPDRETPPRSEALHLQQIETILKPTQVTAQSPPNVLDQPFIPEPPLNTQAEAVGGSGSKVDLIDLDSNALEDEKKEGQKECGDAFEQLSLDSTAAAAAQQPTPPAAVLRQKRGTKVFAGIRQSKFKHLRGTAVHKSEHIDNLKNVDQRLPGESDMFHANPKFCAVPLSGPGGSVAILKVTEPGRLPDTGVLCIENAYALSDFCFDPFEDNRLVTACEDGKVRVWDIPEGGLTETITQPTVLLKGHGDRVNIVRFHPLAKNILLSAAYDLTVKIWDIKTGEECMQLSGHTDLLLCASWSPDGRYIVTVCRDGRLRLFSPRQSSEALQEGEGPDGTRGARAVWTCNGKYLVVVGMDKSSCRVLMLYDLAGLALGPLQTYKLSMEPALLIPYYDQDTNTLFLTGRGETLVQAYEVAEEPPYFFPLSNYNAGSIHQALSFLPKRDVDVHHVEFAKALRLTTNKVEPISFTVPRVKTEYFQDDLYPDTEKTWEPVMTSEEWLSGINRLPEKISLKPKKMELLSSAPVEERKTKYETFETYQKTYKTEDQKKEELLSAMSKKLDVKDTPLPQDLNEGVEEDEWDDY